MISRIDSYLPGHMFEKGKLWYSLIRLSAACHNFLFSFVVMKDTIGLPKGLYIHANDVIHH